ncbi:MAG: flagellar basal body protein FliL [Magnetococcales bacterium]|nr:flagellar basal body protein FliL [Magnetococcales bacterium]PPR19480.1 MAG: Flagellar FliL protein [Pseudomonadota bacterium]
MAEEELEQQEGAEGEEGAKKGGSKLLIIILLSVILIGGAGVGAFLFIGGDDDTAPADAEATVEKGPELDENGKPIPPKPSAYFYEVPEILVNLASGGSATRYLKLKVNLEVKTEQDLTQLEYMMPRIVDDFQLYLRQLRVEDLNGSSGIYRLKEDLLMRANQAAAPLQISNVLFKEILVQ